MRIRLDKVTGWLGAVRSNTTLAGFIQQGLNFGAQEHL